MKTWMTSWLTIRVLWSLSKKSRSRRRFLQLKVFSKTKRNRYKLFSNNLNHLLSERQILFFLKELNLRKMNPNPNLLSFRIKILPNLSLLVKKLLNNASHLTKTRKPRLFKTVYLTILLWIWAKRRHLALPRKSKTTSIAFHRHLKTQL